MDLVQELIEEAKKQNTWRLRKLLMISAAEILELQNALRIRSSGAKRDNEPLLSNNSGERGTCNGTGMHT